MIQTEIKSFEKVLSEAIEIATKKQAPQLLSVTEKIESINPFHFFDQAKQIEGDRVFWASSADEFYLVGAGETNGLEANVERFERIEQLWKQTLSDAIIHNAYQVPGTGPIAVGGFSFDPKKEKTALWENFQESQFRVPKYLLTVVDQTCYLTVNVTVCNQDHSEQLQYQLEHDIQNLLKQHVVLPDGPVIKSKNEIAPEEWKSVVRQATNEIKQKQVNKIVLARELRVTFEKKANVSPILCDLMKTQTSSYIFAFENNQDCFLGATPERLVSVQDQQLLSTCLAGTAPRGKSEEKDREIGAELLQDIKNREEHQFVVEMIREAVSACCEDVYVPKDPILYPLKNLQHLYTPVKARLKKEFSILDVVSRLHPTPALGGFPKEKSITFIREHEKLDRGWYGAPIGWLDAYQNGEFAVAIRSALIQEKEASLFSGCGVVRESDPEAEYQETTIKFTPMLSVLGG